MPMAMHGASDLRSLDLIKRCRQRVKIHVKGEVQIARKGLVGYRRSAAYRLSRRDYTSYSA